MIFRKRGFLVAALVTLPACAAPVCASAATVHDPEPAAASAPAAGRTPAGKTVAKLAGTWYYQKIDPGVTSCPPQMFCIWNGLGYTGDGLAISGNWSSCEAFSWQNPPAGIPNWENRVYSLKNNATGGVSVWNRRAGGGLSYDWLYDLVPGAYSGDFPAGRQADLVAYDPSYTCTTFPAIYTFRRP